MKFDPLDASVQDLQNGRGDIEAYETGHTMPEPNFTNRTVWVGDNLGRAYES